MVSKELVMAATDAPLWLAATLIPSSEEFEEVKDVNGAIAVDVCG